MYVRTYVRMYVHCRYAFICSFYRTYISCKEDTARFEQLGHATSKSKLHRCFRREFHGLVRAHIGPSLPHYAILPIAAGIID